MKGVAIATLITRSSWICRKKHSLASLPPRGGAGPEPSKPSLSPGLFVFSCEHFPAGARLPARRQREL